MAKINVEYTEDFRGISCIKVSKKKGKLNYREVYELLEKKWPGCLFVQTIHILDSPPEDIYEEGDTWILYEVYDIIPHLVSWQGGIDCFPQSFVDGCKRTLLGGGTDAEQDLH